MVTVYRYDGEEFIFLTFPLPEGRERDWNYGVTGIAKGKGGRLTETATEFFARLETGG